MPIVSRQHRSWLPPAMLSVALACTSCTGDPTPPASGDLAGTSLVIGVADEPVSVNPLAGYAEQGAAKIYDGLVEHRANSTLRPVLATDLPTPGTDGRSWTVKLRTGVTFTDGTPFDAADVVATYRALLDPAYASPERARFSMLTGVQEVDSTTVRFDLSRPYAPFPNLLVLGILPSEALATPAPVTEGIAPPGTGPYKLTQWLPGQRMVLEANKSYFDGPPAITTVTVQFIADDNARAEQMKAGKLDGAALPPSLAKTLDGAGGLQVVAQTAADVHTVLLPAGNPVTADPALRLALNYVINRKAILDSVLGGKGTELSTPMPDTLPEFVEPSAHYDYDPTKALDALAEGGWLPGQDGMRAKSGTAAKFTLVYRSGDALAKDLAVAFATSAKGIGVQVSTEAADASKLTARAATDAVLLDYGDPFDPDLSLFALLHGTSSATIDAALDAGRTSTDPTQRAAAYRKLQRAYLSAPTMVVLTAPNHTYVMRQNWNGYEPVVDADTADLTWGAWWNLQKWTPRR